MNLEIKVPDIGDFKNVEIIEVLVKEGDQIKKNDPILTLEYFSSIFFLKLFQLLE